jgi:hypothetical protein
MINIICDSCGKYFLRNQSEVNRNQKLGRKIFCSRSCANSRVFSEESKLKKNHFIARLRTDFFVKYWRKTTSRLVCFICIIGIIEILEF